MTPEELARFSTGIQTTGFLLENRVVEKLLDAGWSVISNRYYEDDTQATVREIDVLAYRVEKLSDFDLYTCLLVSCKKSQSDVWAFLSRPLRKDDPNTDRWPVHAWSNLKSLTHMLAVPALPRRYHAFLEEMDLPEAMSLPEVDVFAYQELGKNNGACHNQTAIFGALTGLLKAQAYEMGSLPKRKGPRPCLYQFNLLSVVDSEMVRLSVKADVVTPAEVDSEHLISSYIVGGRQSFSRIRFLTASGFERVLSQYKTLHELNSVWFQKLQNEFYAGIVHDQLRRKVLEEEFKRELKWRVGHRVFAALRKSVDVRDIWLLGLSNETLQVNFSADEFDDEVIRFVTADKETRDNVASALKKVYRYVGEFVVSADDIPF